MPGNREERGSFRGGSLDPFEQLKEELIEDERGEGFYRDDIDYLQDVQKLYGAIRKAPTATFPPEEGDKAYWIRLRMKRRRDNTRKRNIRLSIDNICRRYNLDELSELIVCALALVKLTGDYDYPFKSVRNVLGGGSLYQVREVNRRFKDLRKRGITLNDKTRYRSPPVLRENIYQHLVEGIPLPERDPQPACRADLVPAARARKILKRFTDPRSLKAMFDRFVVGQDESKIALSTAIFQHLKRTEAGDASNDGIKSNILLVGPTGCGKTHLVKTLAENLGLPYAIGDATSWTEAGYVGAGYEEVFWRLYQEAGRNLQLAEIGIVFIDEADKLSTVTSDSDIMGTPRADVRGAGVQRALLKALEGSTILTSRDGSLRHMCPSVRINTRNIFFVLGGAFTGLEEMIKRRSGTDHKRIGFSLTEHNSPGKGAVTHEDLIEYGFLREFAGRIPTISRIHHLTRGEMISIAAKGKNSLVGSINRNAGLCGLEFRFTRGAIDAVVDKAMRTGTGARSLKGKLNAITTPYIYELAGRKPSSVRRVRIDRRLVLRNLRSCPRKFIAVAG